MDLLEEPKVKRFPLLKKTKKQKENSKSSHQQLSVEFASAQDKWRPHKRKKKKTGDLCSSPPPTVSSYRGCMMPEKESLIMQREAGAATTLTCRQKKKNTAVGPAHSSHRLEYMTYQICKHSGQRARMNSGCVCARRERASARPRQPLILERVSDREREREQDLMQCESRLVVGGGYRIVLTFFPLPCYASHLCCVIFIDNLHVNENTIFVLN